VTESEAEYGPAEEEFKPPPRVTRTTTRRPRPRAERARRAPSRARKPPVTEEPSIEDGVKGILQIPAGIALLAGQRMNSIPIVADGATILYYGDDFAKVTIQLAETDPRFMALLERAVKFGPYGMALSLIFAMGLQFSRNHEVGQPELLEAFGAMKPEEIISKAGIEMQVQVSPDGQRDGTQNDQAT
jgi:hypothetical protein